MELFVGEQAILGQNTTREARNAIDSFENFIRGKTDCITRYAEFTHEQKQCTGRERNLQIIDVLNVIGELFFKAASSYKNKHADNF